MTRLPAYYPARVIIGAAVCPAAPFLVEGVAPALAERLSAVRSACDDAMTALPPADAVLLLTVRRAANGELVPGQSEPGGGAPWRRYPPGTPISTRGFGRGAAATPTLVLPPGSGAVGSLVSGPAGADVLVSPVPAIPLAVGPVPGTPVPVSPNNGLDDPAVGTLVGAQLLAGHPGPVTAVEIVGDPGAVVVLLQDVVRSRAQVSVVVVADGSACHGDKAPGGPDGRSSGFDDAVTAAFRAGDPDALAAACQDKGLARQLQAAVEPLVVLAALTRTHPPAAAEVRFAAAPLGVWYLVGSWRWDNQQRQPGGRRQ